MCYNEQRGSGIMAVFQVGDILEAVVTGIEKYGIFVRVNEEYNGLIHISEISAYFVKNIEDYVSVGEEILCEVVEIDAETKHLRLSIKNINYKLVPKYGKIKDTKDGFKALQKSLPVWMREKLKEMDNEKML